jgi:hypothetical protein
MRFEFPNSKDGIQNFIIGKIVSVDEDLYSCQIKPDKDNIPQLENVPLRVFNLKDDFGCIIVPEIDSPCLVGFIEGKIELPTLFSVQHWQKILINSVGQGFSLAINKDGTIELETKNNAKIKIDGNVEGEISGELLLKVAGKIQLGQQGAHKAGWGDQWLISHNVHIHPTPTGPSGPPNPPLQDSAVNSQQVKLD